MINNIDFELLVRDILNKITKKCNYQLRSFCFSIPTADDDIVKELEEMINVDNLSFDFTIKCIIDKIYMQWK